ncbi:MAG: hypothetical protein LBM96_06005 [Methanobrevibacter sp.]|jgi:hypothetical protein|nr:hypothetical protein [Candidatus Methanoflexus mossambicus]
MTKKQEKYLEEYLKRTEKYFNNVTKEELLKDFKMFKKYTLNRQIITSIKKVSSNGMNREIKICVIKKYKTYDNQYLYGLNSLSLLAVAAGFDLNKDNYNIKVKGCGMDMIFHVLYEIRCAANNLGIDIPNGSNLSDYHRM